nr:hypothetical protein [Halomicroarcula sp. YJ-61-S]
MDCPECRERRHGRLHALRAGVRHRLQVPGV